MSAINGVGEALAKVLEPWPAVPGPVTVHGARSVVATSGVMVDLNMARPFNFDPNTLYGWPVEHRHEPSGANQYEEIERFGFEFVYVAGRLDEEAQSQQRREVSDALDARAEIYSRAVAGARSHLPDGSNAPWAELQTAVVTHNTTTTFGVRGVGVGIAGYRVSVYP